MVGSNRTFLNFFISLVDKCVRIFPSLSITPLTSVNITNLSDFTDEATLPANISAFILSEENLLSIPIGAITGIKLDCKHQNKNSELNSNFKNLSSLLLERKNEIWNQLTSEHMLKKGACKEESLKHALDFNYQFVIELTNLKRYDSVNNSSLYTWLSENL